MYINQRIYGTSLMIRERDVHGLHVSPKPLQNKESQVPGNKDNSIRIINIHSMHVHSMTQEYQSFTSAIVHSDFNPPCIKRGVNCSVY